MLRAMIMNAHRPQDADRTEDARQVGADFRDVRKDTGKRSQDECGNEYPDVIFGGNGEAGHEAEQHQERVPVRISVNAPMIAMAIPTQPTILNGFTFFPLIVVVDAAASARAAARS